MKNYLLFIFMISLLFTACRKDELVVGETTIVIPPSEEIDVTRLTGQIKDRTAAAIAGATIQLIDGNEIIAETTSNEDGFFEFADIDIEEEYLIFIQYETYASTLTSLDFNENQTLEFVLIEENENPFLSTDNALNPFDGDLITVSGTVVDLSGQGVETFVYVAGENSNWSNYALTQADGTFEVLVKKDENFFLFTESNCFGLDFELFPAFSADNSIGVITQITEQTEMTFSGSVTDCDGIAVSSGYISILSGGIFYEIPIEEGIYNSTLSFCANDFIEIFAIDNNSNAIYFGEIINTGASTIVENITICQTSDYYVEVELDGIIFELGEHFASTHEHDLWTSVHPVYSWGPSVCFSIIKDNTGNEITDDFFFDLQNDFYFSHDELDVTITSNPLDEFLEGTIEGMVYDGTNNNAKEIFVDFKILKY